MNSKALYALAFTFAGSFWNRCHMPCLALAATSNLYLPLERVDCTKHSAQMFNQHSAISIQPRCSSRERQTKPSVSNTALTNFKPVSKNSTCHLIKHSRATNEGMLEKTIQETVKHILKPASIISILIWFPFYVIFSLLHWIIVSSGWYLQLVCRWDEWLHLQTCLMNDPAKSDSSPIACLYSPLIDNLDQDWVKKGGFVHLMIALWKPLLNYLLQKFSLSGPPPRSRLVWVCELWASANFGNDPCPRTLPLSAHVCPRMRFGLN